MLLNFEDDANSLRPRPNGTETEAEAEARGYKDETEADANILQHLWTKRAMYSRKIPH